MPVSARATFRQFLPLLALAVLLWGCPSFASAAESEAEFLQSLNEATDQIDSSDSEKSEGTGGWGAVLRMFAALAIVLALIALAAFLLRRYGKAVGLAPGVRGDAIRIITTKMLGGRRSLMLVRVRGQTLLLGVTPQAINCLTEIHEVEGEWAQPPEDTSASSFDRHLGRFVDQTVAAEPNDPA